MPFSDIEAKTNIDTGVGGFTVPQKDQILAAMKTAYDGSATAKTMMDDWIATGQTIDIDFKANVFQAFTLVAGGGTGDLEIDLGYLTDNTYVTPTGKAVEDTLLTGLVHELGHGLTGRRDNGDNVTDYKGDNVKFVNTIFAELGLDEQISYIAYDEDGSILEKDRDYTNGAAIDVATALNQNWNSSGAGNSKDLLIDGGGSNKLISGAGNDFLVGQGGNDTLAGDAGTDTAVYDGKPTDYDIRLQNDGSWTVRHARGDMDEGADRLENIEKIMFADNATFDLKKDGLNFQTDFALVVDTTGSMGDDIAAVKANATTIINNLFDDDKIDARIGIVSYKDNTIGEPTTVVLPFTDQDDFADRRTAALNAINSLSVSGGGDTPETAFDGLLKALNGTMGDWRAGATTQRVVLFTDAPAKDGALAAQVAAFAADIGATISGGRTASKGGVSLDTFHFSPASADESSVMGRTYGSEGENPTDYLPGFVDESDPIEGPTGTAKLEIFTIYTGSGTGVTGDLDAIAAATGGAALRAPDPDDLADILLGIADLGSGVNEIVGTNGDDILPGTPGQDSILGDLGDDFITPGGGFDFVDLGGGADTVEGTGFDLVGDTIMQVGRDDTFNVVGASLTRADLGGDLSDGIFGIDLTGDGVSNGMLTLQPETGDFSDGDFMAARMGSGTQITFESFLIALQDKTAVGESDINGIVNAEFLNGHNVTDMTVTFEASASAGFNNTIGYYEIDPSGQLVNATILAANAKTVGGPIDISVSDPDNDVGFFLVQDGGRRIDQDDFDADDFDFISDGSGGFDLASQGTVLSGINVFFSHDAALNPDGMEHVLSGVSDDGEGALRIGFEDLLRNGRSDDDFQDVILYVDIA